MKILITGASGFIGSFLVEEALRKGFDTWAGVRGTSSREYLKDADINFVELNFADKVVLRQQLQNFKEEHGTWDYIVHAAGATKCRFKRDFYAVNYYGTKHFVDALKSLGMMPKQFIYISTLSVFGAIHEKDYAPISSADAPKPNTAYGASKLQSEQYIKSLADVPYVIMRPTGVYGPREKDYFIMAKSIKQHIDFSVGYSRQDITFVYVKDLVKAIFLAIDKQVVRREYFVSDGRVYTSRTFSDLLQHEIGNRFVLHICAPVWFLWIVSLVSTFMARLRGTTTTLNLDKYKILKQRNWQCDIKTLVDELGYAPDYILDEGVKETVEWYKKEGWL